MHALDAALAGGEPVADALLSLDPELSADGVDEVLTVMMPRVAEFVPRPALPGSAGASGPSDTGHALGARRRTARSPRAATGSGGRGHAVRPGQRAVRAAVAAGRPRRRRRRARRDASTATRPWSPRCSPPGSRREPRDASEEPRPASGRGSGPWPDDPAYDPELLEHGDRRNVVDRYRYWRLEAIVADLDTRRHPLHVAIENWGHDFNIGSVVRTANAFNVAEVHVVGRRRWNRRGAMVTDRYLHVRHHEDVAGLVAWAADGRACR